MYEENKTKNKTNQTTSGKTVLIKIIKKIHNRCLTWRTELRGKTRYFLPEEKRESRPNLLVPEEKEVDMPLLLGPKWKAQKGFTSVQR